MYRILYVEDEAIQRKLVSEALEQRGYQVTSITNGNDAFRIYKKIKPHLCLVDVMLPGKNGFDLVSQIRAEDTATPVIFLTAKVAAEDLTRGFKSGCNDYVRKPFSMEEVLLRIETWLSEKYGQVNTPVPEVCNLSGALFYPHKQQIHKGSEIVELTYKEAAILTILYQARNNIVSRDLILKKIWGDGNIFNSRTLDVYITRLRKYLEGSANQVVTLKGIGYRFLLADEG